MISNAKLEIAAPVVITFAVFVMHLLLPEQRAVAVFAGRGRRTARPTPTD